VTSELQRSTSVEMYPATSRATSFSPLTLRESISADALMVPRGLRNSWRVRLTLSESGESLAAPHGSFGFAELLVGFRKLIGESFMFGRLRADRLRQQVHQLTGDHDEENPEGDDPLVVWVYVILLPVDKQKVRKVRGASQN